jgi:uncharacterized membrane protein
MMGIQVSLPVMKDFFNNHVYKDSLLCIQDFISDTGLYTKAIRYNKPDIEKLPTPFIVTLQPASGNQNRFAIVSEISETKVKILDPANYKWRHIDKQVFIEQWTKVALLAEDGRSEVVKQAVRRSGYDVPYVAMRLSIVLITTLLLFRLSVTNVLVYLISILNVAGIIISFYLVKLDFGYNNSITNKFCNISGKFSCNEILASKGASIFNIKWAIIGLSYFVANFVLSLFIFLFLKEYKTGLFAFNCLPLLFVGYSLFYQWIVEKKWCVLCLLVQGILVAQFITLRFNNRTTFSQGGKDNLIDALLLIMLTHLLSLYIINFVLAKRYRFIESTRVKFFAYKKALLTTGSFDHFTFTAQTMDAPELGIFIGNPKASNSILLISTPSCRFCADAILDLLSLTRGSYNVRIQLLFLCYASAAATDEQVINYFLNLHKQEAPARLCDALYYWALKKPAPYNFINAFPLKGTIVDCKADIESMASWCAARNIDNVPTLFVNGRPLPYVYDIKDLKFALT